MKQMPTKELRIAIRECRFGKLLPSDFYVHYSAIANLPKPLFLTYERARHLAGIDSFDLIKFGLNKPNVSFLRYDNFIENPHPALISTYVVNLETNGVRLLKYGDRENPPILHRKETFLSPNHPSYSTFRQLTMEEERLGLLSSSGIGTLRGWNELLSNRRLELVGHVIRSRTTAQ